MSKLKLLLLSWLMLVGFASGYSQEVVKCIVIETNSGGKIECNLTKHPKLTQNNDVVTLTTDETVTEFSTTDLKKVYFGEDKTLYKLTYYVDGELYKLCKYEVGEIITPEAEPVKEGYDFSGWSEIPSVMPANDVVVTGSFTTGINGIHYDSRIISDGDYYTLKGLNANEIVNVYDVAGKITMSFNASEKGELTIRSSQLSTGVNIIKTKNQSFKVIRK